MCNAVVFCEVREKVVMVSCELCIDLFSVRIVCLKQRSLNNNYKINNILSKYCIFIQNYAAIRAVNLETCWKCTLFWVILAHFM